MSKTKTVQTWSLASAALRGAYTDFILSRQAMNCTPVTMSFYRFTAGKFLEWIEGQNVTSPDQVTARHVRQFLAELIQAADELEAKRANLDKVSQVLGMGGIDDVFATSPFAKAARLVETDPLTGELIIHGENDPEVTGVLWK